MYHIAIWDDRPEEAGNIALRLKDYRQNCNDFYYKAAYFDRLEDLISAVEDGLHLDLLFVHSKLCQLDDFQGLAKLQNLGFQGAMVFRIQQGQEVAHPLAGQAPLYLYDTKDVSAFCQVLQSALERCHETQQDSLRLKGSQSKITVEEIVCVEAGQEGQRLLMKDGTTELASMELTELAEKLTTRPCFAQVGGRHLVNLEFVARFTTQAVTMTNGAEVPFHGDEATDFKNRYSRYLFQDDT